MYCSDNAILVLPGLNWWLYTKIILVQFLIFFFIYDSFYELHNFPSQPFLDYWALSLSGNSWFCLRMPVMYILKLNKSKYLSQIFQLNEGFSGAAWPCFSLCDSFRLADVVVIMPVTTDFLADVIAMWFVVADDLCHCDRWYSHFCCYCVRWKATFWDNYVVTVTDGHTPSKVCVLESITFSHTPEEALSVGLAKACVLWNNWFCSREIEFYIENQAEWEVYTQSLFWSNLYSDNKYTCLVSLYGFYPSAQIVHTYIQSSRVLKVIILKLLYSCIDL